MKKQLTRKLATVSVTGKNRLKKIKSFKPKTTEGIKDVSSGQTLVKKFNESQYDKEYNLDTELVAEYRPNSKKPFHIENKKALMDYVDLNEQEFKKLFASVVEKKEKGGWFDLGKPKSAINRDRKYQSQQPHEQKYKRQGTPKHPHYKTKEKGGSTTAKGEDTEYGITRFGEITPGKGRGEYLKTKKHYQVLVDSNDTTETKYYTQYYLESAEKYFNEIKEDRKYVDLREWDVDEQEYYDVESSYKKGGKTKSKAGGIKVESYLPIFPGFYNTLFQADEERVIEEPYKFDDFDYKTYEKEVGEKATEVVEEWLEDFNIKVKFQSVSSPREYNFANDSIHVEYILAKDSMKKILDYLKEHREEFEQDLKDRYTSRSGFMSFHSTEADEWITDLKSGKDLSHKLGSVLEFILKNEGHDDEDLYYKVSDSVYLQADLKQGIKDNQEYIETYTQENYKNKSQDEIVEDIMNHFNKEGIDYSEKTIRRIVNESFEEVESTSGKLFAKGGSIDLANEIKKSGKITEQQINLIKNRMNNNKLDETGKELVQWIWDNTPELTSEQNEKGITFLRKLWKTPTGAQRKNSPFGQREEQALDTFQHFTLDGFHDISRGGQREFNVPIYGVYGKEGNFQYYYDGKVNIIGAKGMKVSDKGEINGLYDLRVGLGAETLDEKISRAIRDLFFRKNGELDKEIMDKTISALSKNTPAYKKVWDNYVTTFEIKEADGKYVNPFVLAKGGKTKGKWKLISDSGDTKYYVRDFGYVEIDDKKIPLVLVVKLYDLISSGAINESELPHKNKPVHVYADILPKWRFISKKIKKDSDADAQGTGENYTDVIGYMGGVPLNLDEFEYTFSSIDDADKYWIKSKEVDKQLDAYGNVMIGFIMDKSVNKIGNTGWDVLNYVLGKTDKMFEKGGSMAKGGRVESMKKVLRFINQYPNDWVQQAFGDDPHLAQHLQSKWEGYARSKGSSYDAIVGLMTQLDLENERKLMEYIDKNFEKGGAVIEDEDDNDEEYIGTPIYKGAFVFDDKGQDGRFTVVFKNSGEVYSVSYPHGVSKRLSNVTDRMNITFGYGWRKGRDKKSLDKILQSELSTYLSQARGDSSWIGKEIKNENEIPDKVKKYIDEVSKKEEQEMNKGGYMATGGDTNTKKLSRAQKQYNKEVDAYNWYVVNKITKHVETGYENRQDAVDQKKDMHAPDLFVVLSKRQLVKEGIENPNEKWKSLNKGGTMASGGEVGLENLPHNLVNGWVVTKDHLDNEFSATDEQLKKIKSMGLIHHFKMYDDDGELYYSGYSNDDSSFNPLDDYGTPNAGATEIRYKVKDGGYETLAKGGSIKKGDSVYFKDKSYTGVHKVIGEGKEESGFKGGYRLKGKGYEVGAKNSELTKKSGKKRLK